MRLPRGKRSGFIHIYTFQIIRMYKPAQFLRTAIDVKLDFKNMADIRKFSAGVIDIEKHQSRRSCLNSDFRDCF